MKTHTENVTIINDSRGKPAFVVMPVEDYEALMFGKKSEEVDFPLEIAELTLVKGMTLAKAWREYLKLSQADVAKKMGITQGAYSKLEAKKTLKDDVRFKLADALGIDPDQLCL
jgi:DNA-binding XRE family transcriptional regulator